MRRSALAWSFASLVVCHLAGCRLADPTFHCTSDAACVTGAASGALCVDGGCALPTAVTTCASGLVFDRSAGARAGQCAVLPLSVAGAADAGQLGPVTDLATSVDLGSAPDLAPSCVSGAACTPPGHAAAVGACAGVVSCTPTPSCSGAFNDTAQPAAAANGSWDWNCNGTVEVETATPSNFTLAPTPPDPTTFCRGITDIATCCSGVAGAPCTGDHWFAATLPTDAPAACGEVLTRIQCAWGRFGNNDFCHVNGTSTVVQACR